MRGDRFGENRKAIVLEGVLFLAFFVLLARLYLVPQSAYAADVRWWTWLAVATPFFLALGVEWRRKKPPILRRQELLTTEDHPVAQRFVTGPEERTDDAP